MKNYLNSFPRMFCKTCLMIIATLLISVLLSETAQAQTSWGSWKTSDCHKGLDFRVKRGSYNKYAQKYMWSVQFRNRYNKRIYFSYTAVEMDKMHEIKSTGNTNHRTGVNPNSTGSMWFHIDETDRIYVYVNNVRFGTDDWGTSYAPCDSY